MNIDMNRLYYYEDSFLSFPGILFGIFVTKFGLYRLYITSGKDRSISIFPDKSLIIGDDKLFLEEKETGRNITVRLLTEALYNKLKETGCTLYERTWKDIQKDGIGGMKP